ncbi:MAG TPA: hypothetical protein VG167_18975 [Verrucomicrobiae bacterium]|nr:hypothetical protein [Verrucomicrobiae bacterium]
MAQSDIYIDTNAGTVVSGINNSQAAALPPFIQGDTPTFRIWLLSRTASFPLVSPYSLVPIAGLQLEAALGDKIGNVTNYYANQFVWAPSTDPNNPNYFIAQFPLNTPALNTLIGSAASAQTTFEVKYLANGFPTTVLSVPAIVQASVIKAGGVPAVPPGLTPLSAEYANATFMTRTVTGQLFFKNPNTGKIVALYLGDDGSMHEDPVN